MNPKPIAFDHDPGLATRFLCLIGFLAAVSPAPVQAQNIGVYFPSGSYGYDRELGVTVLSRARPLYDSPGVNVGGLLIRPSLGQSLLYNSDVTGVAGSGSWGSRTSGSILAKSGSSRNGLDASIGFSNSAFFTLPDANYTDWNAGIGGEYTISDSQLSGAFSHQTYHQFGNVIGAVQSTTPVPIQTNTGYAGYTFNLSRLAITPNLSVGSYQFGAATVRGQTVNQNFLDRTVVAASVVSRYSMSEEGGLLLVLRGIASDYPSPQAGQPSNNSTSFEILGGIDYQADAVWRYRALVGVEVREFQAALYPSHTAPVMEASVIWTPTGLTTVTGTVSREIEDPQSAGTNGYVFTSAKVVADHEIMRNILLQIRGEIGNAIYLQSSGGSQSSVGVGSGLSWLINRRMRLTLDYDYANQFGNNRAATTTNPATLTAAPFTQSVAALTLHFAL